MYVRASVVVSGGHSSAFSVGFNVCPPPVVPRSLDASSNQSRPDTPSRLQPSYRATQALRAPEHVHAMPVRTCSTYM